MTMHSQAPGEHTSASHYRRLIMMTLLSFLAMYVLMYAMVNSTANVFANLNQFYMAALMTAPMVILELALMRDMYHNKRRNAAIMICAAILLILSWTLIRRQIAIGDRQFLRSMIPHHAGAIRHLLGDVDRHQGDQDADGGGAPVARGAGHEDDRLHR